MRFGDLLRALLNRHGLPSLAAASKATGIAQTNMGRYFAGTNLPEYSTLSQVATRAGLTRDETISLFAARLLERVAEESEKLSLWLYLTIEDDDARDRIAAELERLGTPVSLAVVRPVIEEIATSDAPEYVTLRRAIAPALLRSVRVSLLEQEIEMSSGDVLTPLVSAAPVFAGIE